MTPVDGKAESFFSALGSALSWNSGTRFLGIAKHLVLAATIGLSSELDAFYFAVAVLGVLVFSWGQVLDMVAVPRLVKLRQSGNREEFEEQVSRVFSACLLVSSALVGLIVLLTDEISGFATGFDSDRREMLAEGLLLMAPVMFLYIPTRFLLSALKADRRFAVFYRSDFLSEAAILMLLVIFSSDSTVLFWSFSIGTTLSFVFVLNTYMSYFRLALLNPFHEYVNGLSRGFMALFIISTVNYVYVLTDRYFMSFLEQGAVGALAYALGIITLVPSLLSMAGPLLTVFSESGADANQKARTLNNYMSLVLLVAIPVMVFLAQFGEQAVSMIFERGAFDDQSSARVAEGLMGYLPMILFQMLMRPLDQLYFVNNRTLYLAKRALVGVVTNATLNGVFLFYLGWGMFGVALASSISYGAMVGFGLYGLLSQGIKVKWKSHLAWLAWLVVVGVLVATFAHRLLILSDHDMVLIPVSVLYVALIGLGGLLYWRSEGKMVRSSMHRVLAYLSRR